MQKKLVGIFVVMLMISSAMTTILFSNNSEVEASGGEPQGGKVNLDFNWTWLRVQDFANVIRNVNWSENGENGIPKGRSWATAGENYTILNILWKNMGKPEFACGLTNYTNLTIGYLPGCYEPPEFLQRPKQYSSKIVIKDYNLTIYNNSSLYRFIPYSELFPMPVGARCFEFLLTQKYNISEAKVIEPFLFDWRFIEDHCNVSATVLSNQGPVAGKVVFLRDDDSIPLNQSSFVFILNENPSVEQKMENITDASVILIENETRNYTFQNASNMDFTIVKINGSNDNFTEVINEVNNGSTYVVENVVDNQILVFSNFSNDSCFCPQQWVGIHQRLAPSDPNAYDNFAGTNQSGAYYDFGRIVAWEMIWRWAPRCKGLILSDFTDTHFMTHSVCDWKWHSPRSYNDRWWMPTFSVNKTIGDYLINHSDTATVTGFIDQEYRQQTNTTPGVISNNVVAYRNISHSPNDAITVLSNRMDGWWGPTSGDSGVGGAILLGIAKYFNDNNITPKYNLTFLFTTGEEYGMRGAHHFVDSHPNGTGTGEYNFVHFIGFDQLGFNYTTSTSKNISLDINTKNPTMRKIIYALANQTNYLDRNRNKYNLTVNPAPVGGSEDKVWKENCWNTVCFGRDDAWDGYHRTGMNFSRGDSMNYIDRNDVNVTFELAWNVTKYFTVNPDCWFHSTTYESVGSSNNTPMDSIKATFIVESVLPSDLVMVNVTLMDASSQTMVSHQLLNYTVNKTGVTETVTMTMPQGISLRG